MPWDQAYSELPDWRKNLRNNDLRKNMRLNHVLMYDVHAETHQDLSKPSGSPRSSDPNASVITGRCLRPKTHVPVEYGLERVALLTHGGQWHVEDLQ